MNIESKQGKCVLEIPLDVSGIEGFRPEQKVKVLVLQKDGCTNSTDVEFDQKGKGKAVFTFGETPGALRVIVGPANATDIELQGLQTISLSVSARRWTDIHKLELPVKIAPYYWWWWLRWCRNFTIRGRVLCPDGRPVPGAKVCAYDVDAWWWWSSRQLVGCGTTDVTGAFEISFRWCCGWWPWWWWKSRVWQLEPYLIERIRPVLERGSLLRRIPLPDPVPDLRIFEELLVPDEFAKLRIRPDVAVMQESFAEEIGGPERTKDVLSAKPVQLTIDPKIMPRLRERIVAKLPIVAELEALRIWPWWPGHPWWDCTPDIIFRVTQDCQQPNTVIVDEGYGDVRWNIATSLDVTLTANEKACCIADGDDDPQGLCALITDVCHTPINFIGGNPGAAAVPVGYLSPGVISDYGDRPWGGHVVIQGQMGNAVDYYEYEFQYSADNGVTWSAWSAIPNQAVGDIPRQYWIPTTNTFQWVPFLHMVDGRLVFESRQRYEATHDPASWGITRFWMAYNYFSLMNWLTETPFLNGTYRLRILGWQLVGGHLVNSQVLPTCSTQTTAGLVLRIDNRLVGAASGHPIGDPSHPCGSGTVHTCTLEPDTDFLAVRIVHADGSPTTPVGACGNVPIGSNDILEVDFFAHDPEGHLAYFTLQATYGENLAVNLLGLPSYSLPGFGLLPLGGAPVTPAAQVGPTYTAARLPSVPGEPAWHGGAVAPVWHGGAMRLRVKAAEAFPRTCCYQLELRAHKRTIVGCDYSLWNHINYSEVSFMVVV